MQDTLLRNDVIQFEEELDFPKEVLKDFWISCVSREASYMGRREVLTGKAKFGIIGDGKEVPQVALARAMRKGDFRSGYYRDQTLMFALGLSTVEDFFAQLYADAENDPFSGGRQMNSHFATPLIDDEGNWLAHTDMYNSSADLSPTAGQMSRSVGLALASKIYKEQPELAMDGLLSDHGREVCIVTIGDASTSEGVFWESVNAAGVLKIPMAIFIWDDGYGISVPTKYQTTKEDIGKVLEGFRIDENGDGFDIYTVKAWDYTTQCEVFKKGLEKVRETHIPAIFHVKDVTQPQGHSTSGSHERYKSKERLEWEISHDCNRVMKKWMIEAGIAEADELEEIEKKAKDYVKECKTRAWKAYMDPVKKELAWLKGQYEQLKQENPDFPEINEIQKELDNLMNPLFSEVVQNARRMVGLFYGMDSPVIQEIEGWLEGVSSKERHRYHTHLISHTENSALRVPVVPPRFSEESKKVNGYQVLNKFFDVAMQKHSNLFAFGEDVGQIGGVNQGFAGLQEKHGEFRIFDSGIREWTIIGQAIGMSMRGLRPIAEIQYLDYLVYAMPALTDDLATMRYRSNGIQMAPAIVRTRGHRLEGIWHAGSPMGMLLNTLRGVHVCVPRNMTQAAGMYNTLLHSDDPGLVIECLNGYRLKEVLPDNIGEITVPLGVPEILQEGEDLTMVTYGSCVRVAQEAMKLLERHGISVELIDVQTLLPFDLEHRIVESLKKTNRIIFVDEDVPGGATAFMMQEVLEKQGGYFHLDSQPVTVTSHEHRPPYGSDGDYFSKSSPEDIFDAAMVIMEEADPDRF